MQLISNPTIELTQFCKFKHIHISMYILPYHCASVNEQTRVDIEVSVNIMFLKNTPLCGMRFRLMVKTQVIAVSELYLQNSYRSEIHSINKCIWSQLFFSPLFPYIAPMDTQT